MASKKPKRPAKAKAAAKKSTRKPASSSSPAKHKPAKPAPKRKPAPARPSKPKRKPAKPEPAKRSPQQRAALTRKRNAAKHERELARRRARRRELKLERESIKAGELARRREKRAAKKRRATGDERGLLIELLERMRNGAAAYVPLSLEITEAEPGARIPWLVVGRFDAIEAPTYAELDAVFRQWEGDLTLEAALHPQRMSQIRIVYSDPNAKRGEGDSIVSHTGPWEAVISEISFELDPTDEDSLASRYANTIVPAFYVYFSGRLANEVTIPV